MLTIGGGLLVTGVLLLAVVVVGATAAGGSVFYSAARNLVGGIPRVSVSVSSRGSLEQGPLGSFRRLDAMRERQAEDFGAVAQAHVQYMSTFAIVGVLATAGGVLAALLMLGGVALLVYAALA